jgi:methionine-rich copper-binding protein CopC
MINNVYLILCYTGALMSLVVLAFITEYPKISPAYAHASPVSYSPPSNSVLVQGGEPSPSDVMIAFSERPEPKASYIRVTNSEGERIDNNDYRITGNNERQATVSLDPEKLKPDVYSVSWLALSRDDGHITRGSYIFTIREAAAPPTEDVIDNNTFSEQVEIDNVLLKYEISPFYAGVNNNFMLTLSDISDTTANNNPPINIRNVTWLFTNEQAGIGPIVATLGRVDNGVYSIDGGYLSQAGEWDIRIVVQRTDAYDLNHSFDVQVNSTNTATPSNSSKSLST